MDLFKLYIEIIKKTSFYNVYASIYIVIIFEITYLFEVNRFIGLSIHILSFPFIIFL